MGFSVPAITSAVGVVGVDVYVGGGIFVGGKVEVTKPGVAVDVVSSVMFKPQLEHMSITARKGKIHLWITSLL